ncbi:MAG: histidine triad nucleotide-binding protein [Thermomicrobiales bacterium]|nr:histidine triad nucleotide-binding protein [Thermomicrobiales bacterium]MCO5224525.1 histidine triad nucleotide-binding protein [Thermomicrobiales bacterium]MCO5228693.1 histidine triad nucleotide-binding protein [Thermomicrobiales bacterium]
MTAYDETCIFCKIANGEFDTDFIAESDNVVAFNDINPVAPVHVLIIPKIHITSVHELGDEHQRIWNELLVTTQAVADKLGVTDSGYRLVTNAGANAGQEVPHLHIHLLGGKKLGSLG